MKTVKSTFSVSFFLKRNAQKANGNMPIISRITINGEVAQFSTKLEIAPNLWSVQIGKALGKSNDALQINNVLDGIKSKIQSHYHSLLAGGRGVTSEILKNSFLGIDDSYETILTIFDKHNTDLKKLVGVDKSNSTYKKYLLARQRVAEFIKNQYKMTDVVAVIDDGFDLNHDDMNFWKNRHEIPWNWIDDDNNGYIDDYDGWGACDQSGFIPTREHGTQGGRVNIIKDFEVQLGSEFKIIK